MPVILQLPSNPASRKHLRINDLVAKIARVTLKDTTRVLMALDAVVDFLDEPADDILAEEFEVSRPSLENSESCTVAHNEFLAWLESCDDVRWLEYLRSLD